MITMSKSEVFQACRAWLVNNKRGDWKLDFADPDTEGSFPLGDDESIVVMATQGAEDVYLRVTHSHDKHHSVVVIPYDDEGA